MNQIYEKIFKDNLQACLIFDKFFKRFSCIRCILRYLKCKQISFYADKLQFLQMLEQISTALKMPEEQHYLHFYDFQSLIYNPNCNEKSMQKCVTCLGILQHCDSQANLSQISQFFISGGFEFSNFKINLQVPYSLYLRIYHQLILVMQETKQGNNLNENEAKKDNNINENIESVVWKQVFSEWKTDALDFKTVYKSIVGPKLEDIFNEQHGKANLFRFESLANVANNDFGINLKYEDKQDELFYFGCFQSALCQSNPQYSQQQQQKGHKKIKKDDQRFQKTKQPQFQLQHQNQHQLQQQEQLQMQESNQQHQSDTKRVAQTIDVNQTNTDKITSMAPNQFCQLAPESALQSNSKERLQSVEVGFTSVIVYIYGRYLKFSREVSQSPWIIEGKRLYEQSIEDVIKDGILWRFGTEQYKFHAGGREDIDVRMLGNGRPFVLEVINPKRRISHPNFGVQTSQQQQQQQQLEQEMFNLFEKNINTQSQTVNVKELKFTDASCFQMLKQCEISKLKAYACVVRTSMPVTPVQVDNLNKVRNQEIKQKTPLRVLHRRTQMVRDKTVHLMKAYQINEHFLVVFVLSSAGMYIKEFVHGDLDRTRPNLGTIMCYNQSADIVQLDVVKLYEKLNAETEFDFFHVIAQVDPLIHYQSQIYQ